MTDEELAKEYAEKYYPDTNRSLLYSESDLQEISGDSNLDGLKKGRDLSDEKAMWFAEFTAINLWVYLGMSKWKQAKFADSKQSEAKDWSRATTSELYTSKAFEDYLNGLKK